jgi:glyoxylase-like metal-dependent hydrolase (beta-lactamase superfamily II)/ferredoxin
MARESERLPENAAGDFFVDRTCIDCATCREVAPATFAEGAGFSFVARQPASEAERRRALMALVACPTASIGTASHLDARAGVEAFPEAVEPGGGVLYCGFTSEASFGASSYLILRPEGNVLVDSPRAAEPLLRRIEALGGVRLMLLTHVDDVADHAKIARRFGCERVMHEADARGDLRGVERKLRGRDAVVLAPGLLAVPTPGHTRGHICYLWHEKVPAPQASPGTRTPSDPSALPRGFLFTGDHLEGSDGRLDAFRDYCWDSWEEQTRSMERLRELRFEWVLPGHGGRFRARSPEAMRDALDDLIARMRAPAAA